MSLGAGKYDDLCTHVRECASAEGAVVIIVAGAQGSGFSVQGSHALTQALPEMLEHMAAPAPSPSAPSERRTPAMFSMGRISALLAADLSVDDWKAMLPDIHAICAEIERAALSDVKAAPSARLTDGTYFAAPIKPEPSAQPPAAALTQAVIDAAILWAYCPIAGGYREGAAIEDTCEALAEAVVAYVGVQPGDEWWTEEEMHAAIAAKCKEGQSP